MLPYDSIRDTSWISRPESLLLPASEAIKSEASLSPESGARPPCSRYSDTGRLHQGHADLSVCCGISILPLPLNTVILVSATKQISVIPCSLAKSTARLLGAPTEMNTGNPARRDFCTSSKDARPDTTTISSVIGV